MFSRTDPTQLAALKTELLTDPKVLGYGPLLTAGAMNAVAALIMTAYPASGVVQLGDVPTHKVRSCISLADWEALTATQRAYLHFLLDSETVNLSDGVVDDNLVKGSTPANPAGGIWPPSTPLNSRGRIMALKQRKATRAEELFGIDTVIAWEDVVAAHTS